MRRERFADHDALCDAAADEFCRHAAEAVAARGRFAVALAGGSTPRGLYQRLARPPRRERVDWDRVELFWGDERAVPPDHPNSNFAMARATLLDAVPVAPERIHRMEGERADLDAAARDYEAALARVLGAPPGGPPPALDLVLLGLGADGHTASLFPGTAVLAERHRWVAAVRVPQLETSRLTLTFVVLNAARAVLFLVAGEAKAAAVADVTALPAGLVRPSSGDLAWYLDAAAASRLPAAGDDR